MDLETIKIRYANPLDDGFIISTWLKYYRYFSPFGRKVRNQIFFSEHHKLVTKLLDKPTTTVAVCCLESDENIILSYVVFERVKDATVIHFVYTKDAFRRFGLAKALFLDLEIDPTKVIFTHFCDDTHAFMQKFPEMIHNPYLAYKGES